MFKPGDRVNVRYAMGLASGEDTVEGVVIKPLLKGSWILVAQPYDGAVIAVECAIEYVSLVQGAKEWWNE